MPHFVLDCSENVLSVHSEEHIIQQVHTEVYASQLFDERDIKVRINAYKTYWVAGKREDFIHVFANIMGGRTTEQKAALSTELVTKLTKMFPNVPNISMNVRDFDKATYYNRRML